MRTHCYRITVSGSLGDIGLVSRLADLARLHDSGALSAAEFDAAKARLPTS